METKFTIVIPSFNERDDIRLSIESAVKQTYENKEILVIDDSTDSTKKIIEEYSNSGVRLVDGPGRGCCEARNMGIRMAKGDIVVILHADVILPNDFLDRIKKHYDQGIDWLLVESSVFNQESLYARYVELAHKADYLHRDDLYATEGFSFRRGAAVDVGSYTGDFDVKFCRDWTLGKKLYEKNYKKAFDRSIVVTHKAPDNFKEFYAVRKTRGRFSTLLQRFLFGRSLIYLFIKLVAKDILCLLKIVLIFPMAVRVFNLSKFSKHKIKDFFIMFWIHLLQEYAVRVGEWEGYSVALSKKSKNNLCISC